MGEKKTD